MKNKDGIKALLGQVWRTINKGDIKLVSVGTGEELPVGYSDPDRLYWLDEEQFHRLLGCPKMGDMRKHLIVTQEQKDKYKMPDCAEWFCDVINAWTHPLYVNWCDKVPYRVPEDFDGWELKDWKMGICSKCRSKLTDQGDCTDKKCEFYVELKEEDVVHLLIAGRTVCDDDASDNKTTLAVSNTECVDCLEKINKLWPNNPLTLKRMKELGIEIHKQQPVKIQLLHGCKGNGAVCGSPENVFSRTVNGITCPKCYQMFQELYNPKDEPQPATIEPIELPKESFIPDSETYRWVKEVTEAVNKLIEERK